MPRPQQVTDEQDYEATATRAITVRARPEHVGPWLVQIGFGRAGWYSYDWLDNLGKPSAENIIPELQTLRIGDWVPMSSRIDERTAFRVTAFEPGKGLLWTEPDSTWVWVLERRHGPGGLSAPRRRAHRHKDQLEVEGGGSGFPAMMPMRRAFPRKSHVAHYWDP